MPRFATLLILLVLAAPPPSVAQSDTPSLADVEAAYDALDALRASFTQVITSDFAGDSTRIDGTVLLSGNRYRVQTPGQTVVTNGETTWIYTPADSQVVVNDADTAASTVTPETFLRAADEQYTVMASTPTRRGGSDHVKLEVSATDSSSQFQRATLWVRQADRLVTRMQATDRNGSVLDLRLRNLTVNPALEADPFRFTPPEGIEVIDLRREE